MSASFRKCLKTEAFRTGVGDTVADDEGRRVQHIGRLPTRRQRVFRAGNRLRGRGKNECGGPALTTTKTFLWWMELSAHGRGAVEVAFNNDNSDVIMETYVAAEVCRAVKDFGCEFLRGQ